MSPRDKLDLIKLTLKTLVSSCASTQSITQAFVDAREYVAIHHFDLFVRHWKSCDSQPTTPNSIPYLYLKDLRGLPTEDHEEHDPNLPAETLFIKDISEQTIGTEYRANTYYAAREVSAMEVCRNAFLRSKVEHIIYVCNARVTIESQRRMIAYLVKTKRACFPNFMVKEGTRRWPIFLPDQICQDLISNFPALSRCFAVSRQQLLNASEKNKQVFYLVDDQLTYMDKYFCICFWICFPLLWQ